MERKKCPIDILVKKIIYAQKIVITVFILRTFCELPPLSSVVTLWNDVWGYATQPPYCECNHSKFRHIKVNITIRRRDYDRLIWIR